MKIKLLVSAAFAVSLVMSCVAALPLLRDNQGLIDDTLPSGAFARLGTRRPPQNGHVGAVWAVTFAPDGRKLATSGADATARVWDLADNSNRVLRTDAAGHSNRAEKGFNFGRVGMDAFLMFTPDGKWLVTEISAGSLALTAGSLALTDIASAKELHQFHLPRVEHEAPSVRATQVQRGRPRIGGDL